MLALVVMAVMKAVMVRVVWSAGFIVALVLLTLGLSDAQVRQVMGLPPRRSR